MLSSYPTLPREYVMPSSKGDVPAWARALRTRRVSLGYRSQEALALKTQEGKPDGAKDTISQRTVSAIETGDQDPTSMTAARLAAYIQALQWTTQEFNDATGLVGPFHVHVTAPGRDKDIEMDVYGYPSSKEELRRQSLSDNLEPEPENLTRPTPATRLQALREQRGLERRELAAKSGVGLSHITRLEEHSDVWAKSSQEVLEKLAVAYEMPYMEFLELINGTPFPMKPNIYNDTAHYESFISREDNMIPEFDLLKAGPGGRGGGIIGYVDRADGGGEQVSYKVSGDSMSKEINDRDSVVIRVQDVVSPGNIIVCYTDDDGTMVKFLKEVKADGTHILTSFNTEYAPIWAKDVTVYGVVIQIRKNVPVINGNY